MAHRLKAAAFLPLTREFFAAPCSPAFASERSGGFSFQGQGVAQNSLQFRSMGCIGHFFTKGKGVTSVDLGYVVLRPVFCFIAPVGDHFYHAIPNLEKVPSGVTRSHSFPNWENNAQFLSTHE